jgi:hypothetical protein
MKRIGQIAITLILVVLIPSGFISGQEKKEQKQIRVIVSDKDGKQSIIIDTTFNDNTSGVKVTEGYKEMKDGEVKYNIEVRQDESGSKTEKTSYVIAKDGMVVTIEGGSEEKVKELAGVIESKLGVKKDDKSAKTEVVKEETKKTTKK